MKHLKRLLFGSVLAIGLFTITQKAEAVDFQLALTTFSAVENVGHYYSQSTYPSISGNILLRNVVLSNFGGFDQKVSIYDTCTSSSAARLALVVISKASDTAKVPDTWFLPNVFQLSNPCLHKGTSDGGTVNATLLYE